MKALIAALLAIAAVPVLAAEKKKPSTEDEAMMQAWMKFAAPGEGHRVLDPLAGDFRHELTYWSKPGAEPQISTGTNQGRWIMGGRFMEVRAAGVSMGQRFEGFGLTGFNNHRKVYESVWIDNMGTALMTATGRFDPAGPSLEEQGTYTDPVEGQRRFRAVTKFVDADHYSYEMLTYTAEGKEFRMLEIRYERVK